MEKFHFKTITFYVFSFYLLIASIVGTFTFLFLICEWLYTESPTGPSEPKPVAEVDLAPMLVPYSMFGPKRDVSLQEVNMPAVEGDVTPATVSTNEHGFRYGEIKKKKEAGLKRIIILGGSVVFYGHTNETTISGYLEKRLREQYATETIQVINAGITGIISDQELVFLVETLIDFEPDAVVIFDGFNDCLMPASFEQRLGYPFKFKELELAWYDSKALLQRLIHLPFSHHLLAGSHFLRSFSPRRWSYANYLRDIEIESAQQDAPVPVPEKVADHFLNNWRKMALFLRANQKGGLFVLQPFNPDNNSFQTQYDLMEAGIGALGEEFSSVTPPVLFRSYRHVMDEKKELFYDIVHTYDAGNAYYAELLQKDLEAISFN